MLITPNLSSTSAYKRQLAKRFDRAASSYDAYAQFQLDVLNQLLLCLPDSPTHTVMDLGTGTGLALPSLMTKCTPNHCVALDLSPAMLAVSRARMSEDLPIHYVCADAETFPFTESAFDLIFSSLAIQWCLQPESLFRSLFAASRHDGRLVFSTLLMGSMPELSTAWLGVDGREHVHQYVSEETLKKQLLDASWQIESLSVEQIEMWFDSPEAAVASLKKVGASLISTEKPQAISPSTWKAFLQQYEKQRQVKGIPLSYQVAFVVARKRVS